MGLSIVISKDIENKNSEQVFNCSYTVYSEMMKILKQEDPEMLMLNRNIGILNPDQCEILYEKLKFIIDKNPRIYYKIILLKLLEVLKKADEESSYLFFC